MLNVGLYVFEEAIENHGGIDIAQHGIGLDNES